MATMRSRSSASSAPCSGCPREKAFSASQVCRMWQTPPMPMPKAWRFFTMPLSEVPPMFTPW